jgi:simple sugar transport system permease protein
MPIDNLQEAAQKIAGLLANLNRLGGFLGSLVLAVMFDGFNVIGVSANPLPLILGLAILLAMAANVTFARLRERGRAL